MAKREVALTRSQWATRIVDKAKRSADDMLEAIFGIGRDLREAKAQLEHGEFQAMIVEDLGWTPRYARMYMAVAHDHRLVKGKRSSLLPPHITTLYKITRLDDTALDRAFDDGVIAPTTEFSEINKVLRLERVAEDEAEVRKLEPRPGRYKTLVLDPAWDYDNLSLAARAKADYAKQGLESLRALDLKQWAEPQCHLYCWATNNYLYEAMKLVEHWGFQYRLTLAWMKEGETGKTQIGLGSYFRHSWEPCVFATLGDTTTTSAAASIPTHFKAPRGKHSEKPEEFYNIVRKASYPPYGEGNQRDPRPDFENIFQVLADAAE